MSEQVDPLKQLEAEEIAEREAQVAEAAAAAPAATTGAEAVPSGEQPAAGEEGVPLWQQHGFKSADAAFEAWQNASQKIQEQGAELGELRKFQRETSAQLHQQQAPAQQMAQQTFDDGTPMFSFDQIQAAVDDGTLTEFQAQAAWADQSARQQAQELERRLMQRFAPLEQAQMRSGAQNALDTLNAELGDDVVVRHAQMIGELVERDRAYFGDPQLGARRLMDAVKAAEFDYQKTGAAGQPRTAGGQFAPADVVVEGGSGAQGPHTPGATPENDPEGAELLRSLSPTVVRDEANVPIPWAR